MAIPARARDGCERARARASLATVSTVGVYVHVPFCERVCPYCDFAVVVARPLRVGEQARYVYALELVLERLVEAYGGRALASLYLGGGTPSLLEPQAVVRIVAAVRQHFPNVLDDCEITLEVTKPGVQRISLAEQKVKLQPGVEYEWSVALVLDPEQRSSDIIASGWAIRVEDAPAGLGGKPSTDLVTAYAEAGLWYDALGTISELIEKSPEDKSLRQIRAGLLRQVGFQNLANAVS